MSDGFDKFINEIYPRIWHQAYDLGEEARKQGLPCVCNLQGSPFCHKDTVLKVYRSAWEQGWRADEIPEVFRQMEEVLKQMPTRPMTEADL